MTPTHDLVNLLKVRGEWNPLGTDVVAAQGQETLCHQVLLGLTWAGVHARGRWRAPRPAGSLFGCIRLLSGSWLSGGSKLGFPKRWDQVWCHFVVLQATQCLVEELWSAGKFKHACWAPSPHHLGERVGELWGGGGRCKTFLPISFFASLFLHGYLPACCVRGVALYISNSDSSNAKLVKSRRKRVAAPWDYNVSE